MQESFPCLGFAFLGDCFYNPNDPANIYFSIGEAIAALGFMIVILQFLKPIYLFRLRAYGVKTEYLFLLILIGFLGTVIAALLPSFPGRYTSFWEYPLFWEILAAVFIGATYAFTTFIALRPPLIRDRTLIPFVSAGASFLSEANDTDRVSFAEDLYYNLPRIMHYASAWERALGHAVKIEFERLKEQGAELTVRGQPPVSAFYIFSHQKELERASYAGTFLSIISDSKFCGALVHLCPWLVVDIIRKLSQEKLHVEQAESFVREIAKQAIVSEESMMARELSVHGFGAVPLLSESLFSDPFILHQYQPLQGLWYRSSSFLSEGYVNRLNSANEMMLKSALKHHGYWGAHYMQHAYSVYSDIFLHISIYKNDELSLEGPLSVGIQRFYKILQEDLKQQDIQTRKALFADNSKGHKNDLVEVISDLIFENLKSISNDFTDFNSRRWTSAICIFMDIYPSNEGTPAGMDPLQQVLAIKLIDRLKRNMSGWYPPISKVLLSVIGPYGKKAEGSKNRTACHILTDAVYNELQKLADLYANRPDKFSDFLPDNVKYDPEINSLTHVYRGGEAITTNLSGLKVPEIDFFDQKNWRLEGENGAAEEI